MFYTASSLMNSEECNEANKVASGLKICRNSLTLLFQHQLPASVKVAIGMCSRILFLMVAKFIRTVMSDTPELLREHLSNVVQNSSLHNLAEQVYRHENFAGKGSNETEMNTVKLVMGGNFRLDRETNSRPSHYPLRCICNRR
jgi:hypothetical protein